MSDPKASDTDLAPEELDKVAGGGGHATVDGSHGHTLDGSHGHTVDGSHGNLNS